EAAARLDAALPALRQVASAFPSELLLPLAQRGVMHLRQGETDQAGPLLEEAVALCRKTLPAEHPLLALALSNLGGWCGETGRFSEARACFTEALAIQKAVLPPEALETAN